MTEDVFTLNRIVASSPSLQRAARDEPTETPLSILTAIDAVTGGDIDRDLRDLARQVKRQHKLPRHAGRDGLFLTHLEQALRNLALRPVTPRFTYPSRGHRNAD